jgi:heme/copper-type cytochrome/quinol oxidase subunit 4
MKLIFYIVLAISLLWTGFVVFANMMKSRETGGFVGGVTLFWAWVAVAIVAAAMWWK